VIQKDLDRLGEWCRSNKFDLYAGKCKSSSFIRLMGWPSKKFDERKDLGVIMDGRLSFLPHIEAITSKSSRMLGFIKRFSMKFHDPYTPKAM
jgi:hypothetical protein